MPAAIRPHVLLLTAMLVGCGDPSDDATSGEPGTSATTDLTSSTTASSTSEPDSTGSPTTGETPATDASTGTGDSSDTSGDSSDTSGDGSEATGDPGAAQELPPIDSAEILEAWLADGSYRTWAAESGVHPSTGPHGGHVRTFVNAVALASLAAKNPEHPQDAATVKELYGGGVDEIIGYAVTRKTASASGGGDTWYWYERIDATTYGGDLGVELCTGCHGGGADYILTPFPLQ